MKSTIVATSFLIVGMLVPADLLARQSSVGGGIGFYTFTTNWYRYNSSASAGLRETYPIHVFGRTQAILFYETSIVSLGPIGLGIRGEVHVGLGGDTKEDWLPLGETISSGGPSFGAAAGLKLTYPLPLPTFGLTPYLAPAFHYSLLNSNGEGVGDQFANRAEYSYSSPWDENIFAFSLGIGAQLQFASVVVSPEYRFLVAGGAASDWDPAGEVSDTGPAFGAFVITLGLAL
ncbi:MAG: hypothetical protein HYW57_08580 [Ignavibacteriales bacterium]|nr:hypothetical protein [Ignavibacteriales bacterium]